MGNRLREGREKENSRNLCIQQRSNGTRRRDHLHLERCEHQQFHRLSIIPLCVKLLSSVSTIIMTSRHSPGASMTRMLWRELLVATPTAQRTSLHQRC